MANSDTAYGLNNKITRIITERWLKEEAEGVSTLEAKIIQSWSGNVSTAQSHCFTSDALALMNECATQIEWAIVDSGNGLKFTIAFGTPADPDQQPWAEKWKLGKTSLTNAGNWTKQHQVPDSYFDEPDNSVPNADAKAAGNLADLHTEMISTENGDHLF